MNSLPPTFLPPIFAFRIYDPEVPIPEIAYLPLVCKVWKDTFQAIGGWEIALKQYLASNMWEKGKALETLKQFHQFYRIREQAKAKFYQTMENKSFPGAEVYFPSSFRSFLSNQNQDNPFLKAKNLSALQEIPSFLKMMPPHLDVIEENNHRFQKKSKEGVFKNFILFLKQFLSKNNEIKIQFSINYSPHHYKPTGWILLLYFKEEIPNKKQTLWNTKILLNEKNLSRFSQNKFSFLDLFIPIPPSNPLTEEENQILKKENIPTSNWHGFYSIEKIKKELFPQYPFFSFLDETCSPHSIFFIDSETKKPMIMIIFEGFCQEMVREEDRWATYGKDLRIYKFATPYSNFFKKSSLFTKLLN